MKIEKIIELLDKHNKTGASIKRLTNNKYTEHQLLEDLLDWACGAAVDQRAFYKLTQMLYKTRDFYNEVAEREENKAFAANALTMQVVVNHMEHEFPWINDTDFVDEVGGAHSPGSCYNPEGHFCGECGRESCKGCKYEEVDDGNIEHI